MNVPIFDELTGFMKPEENWHPVPRRHITETTFDILIVMVLYLGAILAFLTYF